MSKNQKDKKIGFVRFRYRKSIFMLKNLLNNRNFAIFAPRLAYLESRDMKKVIMMIERSKDFFDAYSDNCDGIYAAGSSIEEVKADAEKAIALIKQTLPESQWPNEIKGEYEIEWKFDVASFLEYYSSFMSLAGMEKMTGINQKQLSNYLNHRAVPRKKQTERIREGIHKFARELLSITL